MERLKRSISFAVFNGDRVLIVQRPSDDEDLPNAWGLPAASLKHDESWEDAVVRAGKEKLGVELRVGECLEEGSIARTHYILQMRLYEAFIVNGEPRVPQQDASVTQYQDWKWGRTLDLQPAAQAGSLCCRLFLAYENADR